MTYLAIDIGGTAIKSGLISKNGTLTQVQQDATPHQDLPTFMAHLTQLIQTHATTISGVGIALPGTVDSKNGRVLACARLPFLENIDWLTTLKQQLNFTQPIVLENDGNAAALAEKWQGHLATVQNGAMVVLGTGVGACIFIHDRLYDGVHFAGGEPSFMVTDLSQKQPRAQTAAPLSAVTMIQQIATAQHLTGPDIGQQVFKYLTAQPKLDDDHFLNFTQGVAALIYNMQTILDLEKFVIGGGISAQPLLCQQIQADFLTFQQATTLSKRSIHVPVIQAAKFQNNANLLGAVYPLINPAI